MTRWLTTRRLFVLLGIATIAALAPFAVLAATGTFGMRLTAKPRSGERPMP
jgi:hypothetical protein